MPESAVLPWVTFVAVSSLTMLTYLLTGRRQPRLDQRLRTLAKRGDTGSSPDSMAEFAMTTLPKIGAVMLPESEQERTKLQSRLIHAGFYGRQAVLVFLGVKMLLMVGPAVIGILLSVAGIVPIQHGFIAGAFFGGFGMIGPSFWLDNRKAARQASFRRALPDALDIMVICLEGGGTLVSAIQRVALELRTAHPLLADELNIVQREIQLGRSTGEALRQFADRADLEEVRSLSSVVLQAERYGASMVKSLRIHAETLRNNRIMRAEEMAQKAVVKILFPTALCIMPAMFIVVIGPLAIEVLEIFKGIQP